MNSFQGFASWLLESHEFVKLIHTTTPEIAEEIKRNGFKPKSFIDYKYYAPFGKKGIYFYTFLRQVQNFAWHFKSKTHVDKVALLFCTAPANIVHNSGKIEDGYFVKEKDLDKVFVNRIEIKKPEDIY